MREVPQPMRMLPVAAKPSYGSNARFKRDNALLIHTIEWETIGAALLARAAKQALRYS